MTRSKQWKYDRSLSGSLWLKDRSYSLLGEIDNVVISLYCIQFPWIFASAPECRGTVPKATMMVRINSARNDAR